MSSMRLPILLVEENFLFSKTASDVVFTLVRLAMVDGWEFRGVFDKD